MQMAQRCSLESGVFMLQAIGQSNEKVGGLFGWQQPLSKFVDGEFCSIAQLGQPCMPSCSIESQLIRLCLNGCRMRLLAARSKQARSKRLQLHV
jgi:hypothetical protein